MLDKNYDKKNIWNLEKLSIQNSPNLHSSKIKNLILKKKLNVYGLWFEIKSGNLLLFDDKKIYLLILINYKTFFIWKFLLLHL